VLTGVDRPDVGGELLNFFGRQVRLPVGHARLAIRTGAHMIVGVVRREGPDGYHVTGPRIIEPVRSGDQKRDILQLAQHVADILAGYIRQSPEEWMMFLPVWPDDDVSARLAGCDPLELMVVGPLGREKHGRR